ncbi:MAG TPA: DUF6527 family protein [Ktedonobacterales bacterium]|nr:DUF6527 family protein [Ktedonobacterales bacterium]
MRRTSFTHEFVEFIPSELQEGVLYVSVQYATAVHRCACGCGNKVVTPISPADWQFLFDGDTVSLTPSIGNWQFPCRSHYWIKSNKVRWAGAWTPEQIAAGREREARDHERYFSDRQMAASAAGPTDTEAQTEKRPRKGFRAKVLRWFGR